MNADLAPLQQRLGHRFAQPALLLRALTHRSWGAEHNERLEFLGDAVLQIVVTDHIFKAYPDLPEGDLAKLRASVVSTHALAQVARELGVGGHVLLGRGEVATGGGNKASILADTTEAIIGAIHVSAGPEAAARFVHAILDARIAAAQADGAYSDFKTALQELAAHRGWEPPRYEVTASGPDHERVFQADVVLDGAERGHGVATSKKLAEQRAARDAYKALSGDDA